MLIRSNQRFATALWGIARGSSQARMLRALTMLYSLSITNGEIRLLNGRWYVTHAGLLRLAYRNHCCSIRTQPVREFCDATCNRWVFKAVVYKTADSKGFIGYGDADPSNISQLIQGSEMRIAETRAVNRALRKAYGIGLCSVEELSWTPAPRNNQTDNHSTPASHCSNGHSPNGQPRLRDRFRLLIRQHQLDSDRVKAYGANFCGTSSLRLASREQIETFLNHLAERSVKDREGLVCQLNSYSKSQEVTR